MLILTELQNRGVEDILIATEEEASLELDRFGEMWASKYPRISKPRRTNWPNLIIIYEYPPSIRKAIYTTNAVESLHRVIRKAIKKRKIFPNDEAAKKMIYLAVKEASKRRMAPNVFYRIRRSTHPLIYNPGIYTEIFMVPIGDFPDFYRRITAQEFKN